MPMHMTSWTINSPVQTVWEAVTDLQMFALATGTRIEALTEGPFAVGTRWKEYHSMFGRESAAEWEVTRMEEPTSYRCESDSMGSHWVYDTFLAPEGAGTRMITITELSPNGLGARVGNPIVWPLFSLMLRRSYVQFEADFVNWVESGKRT